jgi:hypothetical protein
MQTYRKLNLASEIYQEFPKNSASPPRKRQQAQQLPTSHKKQLAVCCPSCRLVFQVQGAPTPLGPSSQFVQRSNTMLNSTAKKAATASSRPKVRTAEVQTEEYFLRYKESLQQCEMVPIKEIFEGLELRKLIAEKPETQPGNRTNLTVSSSQRQVEDQGEEAKQVPFVQRERESRERESARDESSRVNERSVEFPVKEVYMNQNKEQIRVSIAN